MKTKWGLVERLHLKNGRALGNGAKKTKTHFLLAHSCYRERKRESEDHEGLHTETQTLKSKTGSGSSLGRRVPTVS